jgi:hypothetical protein
MTVKCLYKYYAMQRTFSLNFGRTRFVLVRAAFTGHV